MKHLFALVAAATLSLTAPAAAFDLEDMSETERAAFRAEVRAYLMDNPEVLMEAIAVLEERQQNAEADALTNGCFDGFDPKLRVALDIQRIKWKVMDLMLEAGGGMVQELERLRLEKKALRHNMKEAKRKKRRLAGVGLRDRDPWQ